MSARTTYRKWIRGIMIARDMTTAELAEMAGLSLSHTRNLISGVFESAPGRRKIEAALDVKIWNDLETETNPKENA